MKFEPKDFAELSQLEYWHKEIVAVANAKLQEWLKEMICEKHKTEIVCQLCNDEEYMNLFYESTKKMGGK